jgi:hypothetical protein
MVNVTTASSLLPARSDVEVTVVAITNRNNRARYISGESILAACTTVVAGSVFYSLCSGLSSSMATRNKREDVVGSHHRHHCRRDCQYNDREFPRVFVFSQRPDVISFAGIVHYPLL